MKKHVVIAGREFRVCNDIHLDTKHVSSRDIWDCYNKPSVTKITIWKSWYNWFYNNLHDVDMGVCSYNCMMFTIEAVAYVEELGDYYYFYITKTRQEIYKLV